MRLYLSIATMISALELPANAKVPLPGALRNVLHDGSFEQADLPELSPWWVVTPAEAEGSAARVAPRGTGGSCLEVAASADEPGPVAVRVTQAVDEAYLRGNRVIVRGWASPQEDGSSASVGLWATEGLHKLAQISSSGPRRFETFWDVPWEVGEVSFVCTVTKGRVLFDELEVLVPATFGEDVWQNSLGASPGVRYAEGKFALGAVFDRPGAIVGFPTHGVISRESGTIELWLCPLAGGSTATRGLLSFHGESYFHNMRKAAALLADDAKGMIVFAELARLPLALQAPLELVPGKWRHIALSWGSEGRKLYVDGQALAHQPTVKDLVFQADQFAVGNLQGSLMQPARCVIDDLHVMSVQLPDEEVAADARGVAPMLHGEHTALLAHFDGQPIAPISEHAPPLVARRSPEEPVSLDLDVSAPGSVPDAIIVADVYAPPGEFVKRIEAPVGLVTLQPKRVAVDIGVLPRGFYRAWLELKAPGASGNASAGPLEPLNWGTVPIWVQEPLADFCPRSIFGAAECFNEPVDERFFRRCQALGVRWMRLPFEWAEIEPERGEFRWAKYDRIVQLAQGYGVQLVPTFGWERPIPAWASGAEPTPGISLFPGKKLPPQSLDDWSEYVHRVVQRYKDAVKWWIPWNEPNLQPWWAPDNAAGHVEFLAATWRAVRRADPDAKVLGCGMSCWDPKFYRACFEAGALEYCDAVGYHPYNMPYGPERVADVLSRMTPGSRIGWLESFDKLRALIQSYGKDLPIFVEEIGQNTRDDFPTSTNVPEFLQARYLVQFFVVARSWGHVNGFLWFSFYGQPSFDLLRQDGSPKLAAVAFATMALYIEDATPVDDHPHHNGVCRCDFERHDSTTVSVLWAKREPTELPLEGPAEVFDMYGRELATFPAGANKLGVGVDPVYVVR